MNSPTLPAPDSSERAADALRRQWPDLDETEWRAMAAHMHIRRLGKGEVWLHAGRVWRDMACIASGALRLYYLDTEGREWNKNFHLEGRWIWPLTPLMREQPADFFVAALEPTQLWTAPLQAIEPILRGHASWHEARLRALEQLLDDKLRREQRLLQCDARQRYEALLGEHPEWLARIPLRHVASYLGMTDVSLSRLRKTLAAELTQDKSAVPD